MRQTRRCDFYRGLRAGFLTGLLLLLAPLLYLGKAGLSDALLSTLLNAGHALAGLQQFASANLQGSIAPFTIVLLFFCRQLYRLHRELQGTVLSLESISSRDQLLDLSASLFFGIGVIWTAIGMRDAMVSSLGSGAVGSGASAFSMLQRLIEGGILIALSTTIVGGIGGYLMRIAKSLLVGQRLTRCYLQASEEPMAASTATLRRIETLLQREGDAPEEQP